MKRIKSLSNARKSILTTLLIFTFVFGFNAQTSARPFIGSESSPYGECDETLRLKSYVVTTYFLWIKVHTSEEKFVDC